MANENPKVVVVTGASAGVGRATAIAFGERGLRVALIARGIVGLEAAAREVEQAGGKALVVPADVGDPKQVEMAADRIETELGPIDIWVNSAMVTVFSPFEEITSQEFERVTQVTYLGTVHGTQAALKRMRPRNRGKIIQVGSALAYRSIPLQSAYCGAKAAVRGFTDAVRVELMHEQTAVEVSMVHLGAVNTPQFEWARSHLKKGRPQPLPPIYQPEVAAESVVWAAYHKRRELWTTFSTFKTIVGGFLLPHIGDLVALKQAYSGQRDTESTEPSDRPDNLFEPVPRDFGASGRFVNAKNRSWYLAATTHRRPLFWGVLTAAAIAGAAVASQQNRIGR